MAEKLSDTLEKLLAEGEALIPKGGELFKGYNAEGQSQYLSWRLQTMAAIEELGKTAGPLLKELENDRSGPYFYKDSARNVLGALKAALEIARRKEIGEQPRQSYITEQPKKKEEIPNIVFIVHGHEKTLLEQTARFLEKLDIEPIVLFEKPSKGRTIIEKLEAHRDVSFALVLLTPDDIGKEATEKGELRPRARQNVILELGYFLGYLGRPNVAVLYDESIELPSDYRGVEYIRIDAEGAWKLTLARELKEAGLNVDMNKAI